MENLIVKKLKKSLIIPAAAVVVGLSIFSMPQRVYGSVFYESRVKEDILKGVTYERSTQVGESGLLDVHVLKIDVNNPNVKISPIRTAGVYGTKENVFDMAAQSGAVAAVNGDFFDMNLSPATPFGTVIEDGKIISADMEYDGYATFFIDEGNNPFIEYVKPEIIFTNNGELNMKVHAMNKYKRDFSAVYFDRSAITNTAELDKKFPDLVKFVVENGVITYVSKGSETVEVPENGYIIVAAATYAQYFYNSVKVGHTAEIKVQARFDFDAIETAIGGAGKILENGNYSNYGYVVGPNGRNPRTAIGVSQDKSTVYMVVADGRNHSVGATHAEMASILLREGAWNAMHLDGGGSSTMVADTNERNGLEVVNSVSGGSMRKVVNGIGVFSEAPLGAPVSLKLNISSDKVFVGNPVTLSPVGLDENLRKTSLPEGSITYFSDDTEGIWKENVFYPSKTGLALVKATFNGFTEEQAIEVLQLAQIVPLRDSLKMSLGDSYQLKFEGISTTGTSAPIENVNYEVIPAELGEVTDNVFHAKGGKSGYIKCYIGDIVTYIDVSIGTEKRWVNNFNKPENTPIEFVASGDSVKGKVFYSDAPNAPGNNAIGLEYSFSASDATQAAYVQFKNPITFADGIDAMVISAYGLNNGGWLRAKVTDANGDAFLLDLSKDFNQKGWTQLEGKIPQEAVHPIKLERLYIAALSNTDLSAKTIYFDDLGGLFPADMGVIQKPQSTTYQNPYIADLSSAPQNGEMDITIAGDTLLSSKEKPENYAEIQNKALAKFRTNSSYIIYAGETDIENTGGNSYKWTGGYNFTIKDNYAIIQMSAAKGGIASTNPKSWGFVSQAKASPANHVIILLDKKPSNLSSSVEYELFKKAVNEIKLTGKNVIVISTEGSANSSQIVDGINYINVGGLFNGDKTVNSNFSTLRLRIKGADIKYQFEKSN